MSEKQNIFILNDQNFILSFTAINCPALPPLQYGFYTTDECTEQKQYFGTICHARCNQGFRLEGATTRQCLSTGKWEETPETRCVGNCSEMNLFGGVGLGFAYLFCVQSVPALIIFWP